MTVDGLAALLADPRIDQGVMCLAKRVGSDAIKIEIVQASGRFGDEPDEG